jgi:hypothetical protein
MADPAQTSQPSQEKPRRFQRRGPPICKFFLSGNCKYGEECRFYHPKRPQQKQQNQSLDPFSRAIQQLMTRYTNSEVTHLNDKSQVKLALKPSDPDFPFELEALNLTLTVPRDLNFANTSIRIQNEDIPDNLCHAVEFGWKAFVLSIPRLENPPKTILHLLTWLDRNLERLLTQKAASTIKLYTPAQLTEKLEKAEGPTDTVVDVEDKMKDMSVTEEKRSEEGDKDESESSSEVESDEEQSESASSIQEQSDSRKATKRPPGNYQIRLPGVVLNNIALMQCEKLRLLFQCVACRGTIESNTLTPNATCDLNCTNCNRLSTCTFYQGPVCQSIALL